MKYGFPEHRAIIVPGLVRARMTQTLTAIGSQISLRLAVHRAVPPHGGPSDSCNLDSLSHQATLTGSIDADSLGHRESNPGK